MPGKLIVVEGMDGSGKSTLAQSLAARPELQPLELWRFPSHRSIGRLIRSSFQDGSIDRQAYLYLMIADAVDAEPELRQQLATCKTVVLDRHTTISGYCYQQEDHHLDDILDVQASHEWLVPDLVLVVNVPVAVARARMAGREKYKDRVFEHDNSDYYERLRQRYLSLRHHSKWPVQVIDGDTEPQVVLERALKILG